VRLVVTGGAGFIGSNFVRYMLRRHDDLEVVNLDKLTYAGNLENLRDVEDDRRYSFVHGDICDAALVGETLRGADVVVNFAAETHVDRSISGPQDFIRTDVLGTHTLLEAVRELEVPRYLQISTDEVYGSTESGAFTEESDLDPSSPYSASKAGGDLLVLAYHRTFGTPVLITRSSNNYGAFQYPEKIVPLFITNAIDDLQLPVYGDGLNVRDWLHVDDNCAGIDLVLREGVPGQVYNIGGGNEVQNLTLTHRILELLGKSEELIRYVADRPGHDRRYAIDCAKLRALGWHPETSFDAGLERTVSWYRDNPAWWRRLKSGEWHEYYARQYAGLGGTGLDSTQETRRPTPPGGP
jgi:dTDP-glucose 4,6-dehydratase